MSTSIRSRLITRTPDVTERAGAALGAALRCGDLVSLDGDLGVGKTCFVRGLASGLGADSDVVRSPTFVYHHVYAAPRLTLHHVDCYRLGRGGDIGFLDFDDLLADGAVVVEWGGYADLDRWPHARIEIEIGEDLERILTLDAQGVDHLGRVWGDQL